MATINEQQMTSRFYAPCNKNAANRTSIESTINEDFSWIIADANLNQSIDCIVDFQKTVYGSRIKCDVCKKLYQNVNRYENHKNLFRNKNKCCICNTVFNGRRKLVEHARKNSYMDICCSCKQKKPRDNLPKHVVNCANQYKYRKNRQNQQKKTKSKSKTGNKN